MTVIYHRFSQEQPENQPIPDSLRNRIVGPLLVGFPDNNGKVSVADARKIVVAIAKNDTDGLLESCDVNNDGKISVADARKIVVAIAKNDYNF